MRHTKVVWIKFFIFFVKITHTVSFSFPNHCLSDRSHSVTVQRWQSRISLFSSPICVLLLSPSPAPPYVSVSMGVTAAAERCTCMTSTRFLLKSTQCLHCSCARLFHHVWWLYQCSTPEFFGVFFAVRVFLVLLSSYVLLLQFVCLMLVSLRSACSSTCSPVCFTSSHLDHSTACPILSLEHPSFCCK